MARYACALRLSRDSVIFCRQYSHVQSNTRAQPRPGAAHNDASTTNATNDDDDDNASTTADTNTDTTTHTNLAQGLLMRPAGQ